MDTPQVEKSRNADDADARLTVSKDVEEQEAPVLRLLNRKEEEDDKSWYLPVQIFNVVYFLLVVVITSLKCVKEPGSADDVLYQLYPKPVDYNHTCYYFVSRKNNSIPIRWDTISDDMMPTPIGRLTEWLVANSAIWGCAFLALFIGIKPPCCRYASRQKRFALWCGLVVAGSISLAISGIVLCSMASYEMMCDYILYIFSAIFTSLNTVVGCYVVWRTIQDYRK